MYYQKFIDFLKKHNLYNEEVLEYWNEHKIMFDYREEEKRDLIGWSYQLENNILTKMNLIVPFIDNDKTVLINIHEYIHLLLIYNRIGKKCTIGIDKEVLPIYYERIFIRENKTKELINYYKYLNNYIEKSKVKEYIIALQVSDILLEDTKENKISTLIKKTKKITKKIEMSNHS